MASPFVQGQLRREPLSIRVETSCGHCGQSLHLEIDSELHYRVDQVAAEPLIFAPSVDFDRLEDPSIIDAF
jgi:hypothetical protein